MLITLAVVTEFADALNVDGAELSLNRSEFRNKAFIKIYRFALYLEQKFSDAAAVVVVTDKP